MGNTLFYGLLTSCLLACILLEDKPFIGSN